MPPAKASSVVRVVIEEVPYEIDVDKLTWGEIAEVEEYFDRPLGEIKFESARGTLILAYLAKKRKQPRTTLAELEALSLDDISEEEAERPTAATRKNSGSRS